MGGIAVWRFLGSYSINDVSAGLPYLSVDAVDCTRTAEVQAYFPLVWTYSTTDAFSRQLDFRPWPDELPRFYLFSRK